MATSFVSLYGKGFWSPDSLLEIFAHFLAQELGKSSLPWAQEYARHLQAQATVGMSGCFDFQLSSLRANALEVVSKAAETVVDALQRSPLALSASSLTALGLGGGAVFERDVEFDKLAKLNTVFQQLLSGNWNWGPDDEATLHTRWLGSSA
jgi:hypothetical protein